SALNVSESNSDNHPGRSRVFCAKAPAARPYDAATGRRRPSRATSAALRALEGAAPGAVKLLAGPDRILPRRRLVGHVVAVAHAQLRADPKLVAGARAIEPHQEELLDECQVVLELRGQRP